MLVLSRKSAERILFPELGIVVTVLSVSGDKVKIGVEAPSSVRVLRQEIATEADIASVNRA